MKKNLFLFSTLAIIMMLFSATSSYGQSLEFENKSECTVFVQLTASQNSCKPQCQTGLIALAPNSSTQIAVPNCVFGGWVPVQFFQIDLTDGGSTATVGLGCGLNSSATYIDCTGDPRTVVMNNAYSATIY